MKTFSILRKCFLHFFTYLVSGPARAHSFTASGRTSYNGAIFIYRRLKLTDV